MRKHLPLLVVLALPAIAGSRFVETQGQVPTTCAATSSGGDGLPLSDVTACRATVRGVDAGAWINGGKLVPYYCEINASSGAGWHEGASWQVCNLETCSKVDAGCLRVEQTCEWKVSNPFGRVAVAQWGLVGPDGGFPFGMTGAQAFTVAPVVRLECVGAAINSATGSTP